MYKKCLERAINKDKRVPNTCINNFTVSHEVLVPGPGVSPAGGGHAAAVGAERGVADHLPHLYQETVHTQAGVFFLHVTENKSILSIRELSTVS